MDDEFLHEWRRPPSQAFAAKLKARLDAADERAQVRRARASKLAALAATVAVVAVAFSLPAVRAGAQAFLDFFRVTTFAGVPFDPQRFAAIDSRGLDLSQVLGAPVQISTTGSKTSFATLEEAGDAAGIRARAPAWLPAGYSLAQAAVTPALTVRAHASGARLQSVLDTLAIDDVTVPAALDGAEITANVPAMVEAQYANGRTSVTLLQARTPEVAFPAGLDLPVLAEIGLRILGLDRAEAQRLAYSVDWRSTLLVPIPLNAAVFREVDVQGNRGLMIESVEPNAVTEPVDATAPGGRHRAMLLWSSGGQVFALHGALRTQDALEIAQSMQ